MRVVFACAAMMLATACSSGDHAESVAETIANARPANVPGISLALCGDVGSYVPASATDDGSLAIDTSVFPVAAGASMGGDELLVVGTAVCIHAMLDGDSRIIACTVAVKPPGDPWAAVTTPNPN